MAEVVSFRKCHPAIVVEKVGGLFQIFALDVPEFNPPDGLVQDQGEAVAHGMKMANFFRVDLTLRGFHNV